jgi:phage-related minor tail protein
MSDEDEAPAPKSSSLVPIKEETVEFTAGMIGGAAGFVVGGPVVAAIGAAAANYISKSGSEAGDIVSAVSKSAIEVYNYLANLDGKYELLKKAKGSLESALDKLKSQDSVDPAAVAKVEDALKSTKAKISEINDEYDIVGAGVTALGVIGDLVEQTVKKVGELNEEYQLTDKAKEALNGAVSKARDATK